MVVVNADISYSMTDSRLFTPGPLTTTHTVKAAMLRDYGHRDSDFLEVVSYVRRRLLEVAGRSVQYEV